MKRIQGRFGRWLLGGSLCCVLGLMAVPALALATEYKPSIEFGKEGSGEGQLKKPSGDAVGGGGVWVADTGNNRIEEFSTTGKFIQAYGKEGNGTGFAQFKEPKGIASMYSQRWHSSFLFVADTGNKRIVPLKIVNNKVEERGPGGGTHGETAAPPIGIAANGANEEVVVTMSNDKVAKYVWYGDPELEKFTSALWTYGFEGSGPGGFKEPNGLAIVERHGGEPKIYVADTGNNRVEIITSPGNEQKPEYVAEFNKLTQVNRPVGVAVVSELVESIGNEGLVTGTGSPAFASGAWAQFGTEAEKFPLLQKYEKEKTKTEAAGIAMGVEGDAYIVNPAKDSVTEWVP